MTTPQRSSGTRRFPSGSERTRDGSVGSVGGASRQSVRVVPGRREPTARDHARSLAEASRDVLQVLEETEDWVIAQPRGSLSFATELLEALLALVDHPDDAVSALVGDLIGALIVDHEVEVPESTLKALAAWLVKARGGVYTANEVIRVLEVFAFCGARAQPYWPALLGWLDEPRIAMHAGLTLADVGGGQMDGTSAHVEAVLACLRHPSEAVRVAVPIAASAFDPQGLDAVLAAALEHEDGAVRAAALEEMSGLLDEPDPSPNEQKPWVEGANP